MRKSPTLIVFLWTLFIIFIGVMSFLTLRNVLEYQQRCLQYNEDNTTQTITCSKATQP